MIRCVFLLAAILCAPAGRQHEVRVERADMARLRKEMKRKFFSYVALLRRGKRYYSGFGVPVGKDFYVVTTSRVLNATGKIQVRFSLDEKKKYDAKVVRADQLYDVAVLKITQRGFWVHRRRLPTLGKTDSLGKGDCVFCCSCPDQFDLWRLTCGAVLNADYEDTRRKGISYIEHTAPLKEGEYGGPLFRVEIKGGKFVAQKDGRVVLERTGHSAPMLKKVELIGMNSQWMKGKASSRLSFALPVETVMDCVKRLLKVAGRKAR